jgi:hypothetical protein
VVGVFCEAELYRKLVLERFEALILSGGAALSDVDASSFAKSLDSEVLLLDSVKTEEVPLFGIFIEAIRQLLMNKINLTFYYCSGVLLCSQ